MRETRGSTEQTPRSLTLNLLSLSTATLQHQNMSHPNIYPSLAQYPTKNRSPCPFRPRNGPAHTTLLLLHTSLFPIRRNARHKLTRPQMPRIVISSREPNIKPLHPALRAHYETKEESIDEGMMPASTIADGRTSFCWRVLRTLDRQPVGFREQRRSPLGRVGKRETCYRPRYGAIALGDKIGLGETRRSRVRRLECCDMSHFGGVGPF
ncbi:hypothetical protein EJ04DRAFT_129478 [Polyplosphaeria fusca]|uniref:Uncharacterized protein n=1 Tax=Polyplosphaeria fusca TaxID=682080 RepID=A0A9P4R0C1_9PLEO|nr:hypothetical protein EJ04DRAFT_129478 [Polyplosphaeria fusca]